MTWIQIASKWVSECVSVYKRALHIWIGKETINWENWNWEKERNRVGEENPVSKPTLVQRWQRMEWSQNESRIGESDVYLPKLRSNSSQLAWNSWDNGQHLANEQNYIASLVRLCRNLEGKWCGATSGQWAWGGWCGHQWAWSHVWLMVPIPRLTFSRMHSWAIKSALY